MDAETFKRWLLEMKNHKLATSDAQCAKLLGLSANSIVTIKRVGTDRRTALACRALLHRLDPYA